MQDISTCFVRRN